MQIRAVAAFGDEGACFSDRVQRITRGNSTVRGVMTSSIRNKGIKSCGIAQDASEANEIGWLAPALEEA